MAILRAAPNDQRRAAPKDQRRATTLIGFIDPLRHPTIEIATSDDH